MLAKQYRLTRFEDFERIKREGEKVTGSLVTLLILKAKNEEYPRFAVIVSRNVSKLASTRNHVSRIIFEGIRQNLHRIDKNYDMLIIAQKQTANSPTAKILQSVYDVFERSCVIK